MSRSTRLLYRGRGPGMVLGRMPGGKGTASAQELSMNDVALMAQGGSTQAGGVANGTSLTAINDGEILANVSGASAVPIGKTVSAVLDYVFGSTRGMILRRGAALWQALALGTSGKFLKSDGTDAVWDTASLPLSGATDVSFSGLANKDAMEYKTSDNKWHNVTLTAYLDDVFGSTRGTILRREASAWNGLALGSSGKILTSDGTDAAWAVPAGSGTVTHTGGALTAHASLVGAGTDDIKALAAATNGQLVIGSTGADPAVAALTAGAGITITNAAGSVTIANSTLGTVTNPDNLTTHAPLIGGANGTTDAKAVAAMTNGQLLIGSTGADPVPAALTAGSNVTITNAAGSITIASASGGGGGVGGLFSGTMSALPTDTSTGLTTWQNQGSAVKSNDLSGLRVSSTDTTQLRLLTKTAPATPYTITALVALNLNTANFSGAVFGWTDGTKIEVWTNQPGSARLIQKWTNASTFSANDLSTTEALNITSLKWWRIADDGTTVTFSTSQDGYNFASQFSVAKASGFLGSGGYTKICFGINCNGVVSSATLMSYAEA